MQPEIDCSGGEVILPTNQTSSSKIPTGTWEEMLPDCIWIQMTPRVDSDRHRDVLLMSPFKERLAMGGDQKVASRCLLIPGAASASGSRAPDCKEFLDGHHSSIFFSVPFAGVDSL